MMMYDRGAVVVVRMRWTDGSGSKPRPAAVLSTEEYAHDRRDIIVVGLTSNIETDRFGDYTLGDWQEAGLRDPTKSKAVLATVSRAVVKKQLGHLSASDVSGIERTMRASLGL